MKEEMSANQRTRQHLLSKMSLISDNALRAKYEDPVITPLVYGDLQLNESD